MLHSGYGQRAPSAEKMQLRRRQALSSCFVAAAGCELQALKLELLADRYWKRGIQTVMNSWLSSYSGGSRGRTEQEKKRVTGDAHTWGDGQPSGRHGLLRHHCRICDLRGAGYMYYAMGKLMTAGCRLYRHQSKPDMVNFSACFDVRVCKKYILISSYFLGRIWVYNS